MTTPEPSKGGERAYLVPWEPDEPPPPQVPGAAGCWGLGVQQGTWASQRPGLGMESGMSRGRAGASGAAAGTQLPRGEGGRGGEGAGGPGTQLAPPHRWGQVRPGEAPPQPWEALSTDFPAPVPEPHVPLQPADEVRGADPALQLLRFAQERAARCWRHLCPGLPIASLPTSRGRAWSLPPQCSGSCTGL